MKLGSALCVACGTVFLAIGVVGIVLPVLPTTPFLLLAAAFYLRGSRRLHAWLCRHPVLGPRLARVSSGSGLTAREKVAIYAVACAMIIPVVVLSNSPHLRAFLIALLVIKAVVFLRLPTAPAPSAPDSSDERSSPASDRPTSAPVE